MNKNDNIVNGNDVTATGGGGAGALPKALSARDVAGLLGIGYQKALNLIKYGDMDYIRLGNCYKVSHSSFNEWLAREGKREYDLKEQ